MLMQHVDGAGQPCPCFGLDLPPGQACRASESEQRDDKGGDPEPPKAACSAPERVHGAKAPVPLSPASRAGAEEASIKRRGVTFIAGRARLEEGNSCSYPHDSEIKSLCRALASELSQCRA